MAGTTCKMDRDPRDKSSLLFLFFAALQNLLLASTFPKVGQPFLLPGKLDIAMVNVQIKHKWSRQLRSEILRLAQNYLARASEPCSAIGTDPTARPHPPGQSGRRFRFSCRAEIQFSAVFSYGYSWLRAEKLSRTGSQSK